MVVRNKGTANQPQTRDIVKGEPGADQGKRRRGLCKECGHNCATCHLKIAKGKTILIQSAPHVGSEAPSP